MSKNNPRKKVIVTTTQKAPVKQTSGRSARSSSPAESTLIFGKQSYLWMGLGVLLIVVGLFLMSGGSMPDPNTWDDSIIYSTRRTVIAPMVILAGLIVEIYAIFKK